MLGWSGSQFKECHHLTEWAQVHHIHRQISNGQKWLHAMEFKAGGKIERNLSSTSWNCIHSEFSLNM